MLHTTDSLDKMFIFKALSSLLIICKLFCTKISSVKLIYNISINTLQKQTKTLITTFPPKTDQMYIELVYVHKYL